MAIAEDKLIAWIEKTKHVAQNLEKPQDLSAIEVLNALTDAIPHLQEENPFTGMEADELFTEAYRILENMGDDLSKAGELAAASRENIEAIANFTLEKYLSL